MRHNYVGLRVRVTTPAKSDGFWHWREGKDSGDRQPKTRGQCSEIVEPPSVRIKAGWKICAGDHELPRHAPDDVQRLYVADVDVFGTAAGPVVHHGTAGEA